MSREAVEDLGLEVGMLAVASVKATTVSVELPAGWRVTPDAAVPCSPRSRC